MGFPFLFYYNSSILMMTLVILIKNKIILSKLFSDPPGEWASENK